MPLSPELAVEFVTLSLKVRSDADAERLVNGWTRTFQNEPWYSVQDNATATMIEWRHVLLPHYAAAKMLPPKGASKPAAKAAAKPVAPKRVNKYAVVVGAPGAAEPEASKRFPDRYHAEQWAFDKLTASCDPRAVAVLHNLQTEINERVISRDEGIRRGGRVVHGDPAIHSNSGNAKGPWMKVQQTRSSFSRG